MFQPTTKLFSVLIVTLCASAALAARPIKSTRVLTSVGPSEGIIGVTVDSPVDNPADNVFHIAVPDALCEADKVWLVYDLDGVQDHTQVSRSINDQLAVGGYLVKRRRGWAEQREQVSARWLKQGDNVVRFTMPGGAAHSYRIKNLRIEFEREENIDNSVEVIFNRPAVTHYQNKAYVKGFVGSHVTALRIHGEAVALLNGEFESVIDLQSIQNNCVIEVEAVHADGSSACHPVEFSGMEHADYQFTRSGTYHYKDKFFDNSSATNLSLQGAMLQAEAGVLQAPAYLSITTLRDVDIPALDAGMENVTLGHAAFRFLPNGTTFAKHVQLTIPFDISRIPDGYTEADIKTYYFDETSHHWIAVPTDTVLTESSMIVSNTTHFTDYINAIIKVPESPEVEAYNSTSMKGIKAANPTAGINLINPPQANNSGSASLGYPLNIPAGRAGMQPQLAVSYNSGGGNGWMGLGWNLTIPSIGIETRWGVPRFDPNNETETYLLNGEQLTPVAHRGEPVARTAGRKQFYPRVEGSFNRIERFGDNPSNYFWVVTDKSGTRYFYGATSAPGTGAGVFDASAVLNYSRSAGQSTGEAADKISQWCLREVRDLNGNTVRYHYFKQSDTGVSGGSPGHQIYIEHIDYTGFGSDPGAYKIFFERESGRVDKTIVANLGFKQVTGDLLKRVRVKFNDEPIRSYEFEYSIGAFYKTLLTAIKEFDSKDNLFTTHTFDYFNDLDSDGQLKPFLSQQTWNLHDDAIKAGFRNPLRNADPLKDFSDEASALGGSKSNDFSVGMAVTVGFNANVASKSSSVGGNFGYAQSKTEGLSTLIDITGDGLPDKVYMDGDVLKYRANTASKLVSAAVQFGEERTITGINTFQKEQSKTLNGGLEAHGPGAKVFAGVSRSKTTSTTTAYISDVNGDQLPDIIKDGKVYFNHIDSSSGDPVFTQSSADTPSKITQGASAASDILTIDPQELESDITENPLHDVVRMWQAPYSGVVSITAPVQLVVDTNPERLEQPLDGVLVSIQVRDNEPIWKMTIDANDQTVHQPTGVDNIAVQKGDRIYFRVGSIFNGSFDQVRWSPFINYANQSLTESDANNKKLYSFSSREDFILSAPQEITPPIDGRIRIKTLFEKPVTTDTVVVEIVKSIDNVETTLVSRVYPWNTAVNDSVNMEIDVTSSEAYFFRVKSKTNINWSAIKWKPYMYYTASYDSQNPVVRNEAGEPLIEFHPTPSYSVFADMLQIGKPFKIHQDVQEIKVAAKVSFPKFPTPTIYDGEVLFSVKKLDTLVSLHPLKIQDGKIVSDSIFNVKTKRGEKLFFEYHMVNDGLARSMITKSAQVTVGDSVKTVGVGLFTKLDDDDGKNLIFGPMYRGWGQFAYNGNRERATQRIIESELRISDAARNAPEIDPGTLEDGDDLNSSGGYDPKKELFIVLSPIGKDQVWSGYDQFTYVDGESISSSRAGEDNLQVENPFEGGTGARAINKISKTINNSFSAGGGVGFASGSYGKTLGDMKVLTDFSDMNGDRYPDIVTEDRIQYTNPLGGFTSGYVEHGKGENHKSNIESDGVSVSGSFVTSKGTPPATNVKKPTFSVGTGNNTAGLSGNFGKGKNDVAFTWMDVNGDGLPDRVKQGGMVELNLGYSFSTAEYWGYSEVQSGDSKSYGGGIGVSIWNGSISAGVSISRSDNFSREALQDVNSDGLADIVKEGSPMKVRFNTGSGFGPEVSWAGASQIAKSSSASEGANAAFTAGIYIPIVNIKITFNPSGSVGKGVSRELEKLADVDGDGYPDYVRSAKDASMTVSRCTIGRTNMLREVKRPLGASFTLDYHREGNTYYLPSSMWVLDEVKMADGFAGDGVDTMMTTFAYEGGFFDRHERENYGFSKVVTKTHDTGKSNKPVYTQVTQTFENSDYFKKGLMLSEIMTDGAGNKWVEKQNTYALTAVREEVKFPALTRSDQKFYEGQSEPGKTNFNTFGYDEIGNVVSYTDAGDAGTEDDLQASITYHDLDGLYVKSSPASIRVTGNGTLYRRRETTIDQNSGNVTQIRRYLTDADAAVYDLEYDNYGNLARITRPANANGQRMVVDYLYDGTVNTYVVSTTNSYGYNSSATYDFRYGQKLTAIDLNGNEISYELDDLGRVKNITGPYEKGGANKTIEFEYHPLDAVPWALTNHYDPASPKNKMQTVIFVDGLGRVLQTKKDAALYDGDGRADQEVMIVSGRVEYDAFSRVTTTRHPITEQVGVPGEFNDMGDNVAPTTTEYDVLNRARSMILPDHAATLTAYGFENDRNGIKQFSTLITDANGKQTEQFTDVRGRVTSVKNHTSNDPVWTSFRYNAINEAIEATDDLGHTTFSVYDNLGRRTERRHPDAGKTTYRYDLSGNLIEQTTANLATEGGAIIYSYDFDRLSSITYPNNPENNVKYTYGETGASDNRAGRIVLQEDASGAQEFFYGPLGEVVKNIRTVVIPQFSEQTFVTEWKYDTWNRLVSMVYPDGEMVEYTYNVGGLLRNMDGKKKSNTFSYVKQLGYDKFEQRVFLHYGNGTKTSYEYEEDRRRLMNMKSHTAGRRLFMDNAYEYDKVNNILSLKNNAPIPTTPFMGGASEYSFSYDDLNRLTSAMGSYKSANDDHSYTLTMNYNAVGGITQKVQNHKRKGQEQKKTTYDLAYTYDDAQPHAPTHIGGSAYAYDANGNQTGWTSDVSGQRRKLMWDEENRLRAVEDNGSYYHYIYDASGERVLKGKSIGQRVFINGEWRAGSGGMGNYSVYVNPYMVLKSGGYTKHYYIEGQRIVSKLGGGFENNSPNPAGNGIVDFATRSRKVFEGIVKNLKWLGADGQILTAGKSGKIPPGQVSGAGNVGEGNRYYYHPDHLGSTSYITDAAGEVYQHLEYTAFGETFVEEHSNTERTPYLFSGKELDDETGMYSYGSRYYDPRTSMFQSVDRFSEKYPDLSPYHYGANNPLRYIDPSGDSIIDNGGMVAGLKAYLTSAISEGNKLIQAGLPQGVDKQKFQSTLSEYQATLNEIAELENSSVIYNAAYSSESGGVTGYNSETGNIDIIVEKGQSTAQNAGLIAHELKHGYQFEKGEISFKQDGSAGILADIGDEVAAYNRQSVLEHGIFSKTWTAQDVIAFGQSKGITDYARLPTESRSLTGRHFMDLVGKTMSAAILKIPAPEIFKGYMKYYKK